MHLSKRQTYFPRIGKETLPMCMDHLRFCDNRHYLQQEARAFRHEGEGHHRGDARKGTDDDEDPPAVELVG